MLFRRTRRETAAEKRERLLQDRIADLEAEVAARDRIIRVKDAEIETLAAIVARDRERVKSEAATYARHRAEQEGLKNG